MAGRRIKVLTPTGQQDWRYISRRLPRNQHTAYYGLCNWAKRQIEVDPRLDAETKLRTLIHEFTHIAAGEDYAEPLIERVEHDVFLGVAIWLKEEHGINIQED